VCVVEVRCVDDKDKVHPDDNCAAAAAAAAVDTDIEVSVRPSMTQPCSVDCNAGQYVSSPCVLSDWTTWSPCSRRCDGLSARSRFMEGHTVAAQCSFNPLTPTAVTWVQL